MTHHVQEVCALNRHIAEKIAGVLGFILICLGAGYPMGYFPEEVWYWTLYPGIVLIILVSLPYRDPERPKRPEDR